MEQAHYELASKARVVLLCWVAFLCSRRGPHLKACGIHASLRAVCSSIVGVDRGASADGNLAAKSEDEARCPNRPFQFLPLVTLVSAGSHVPVYPRPLGRLEACHLPLDLSRY